MGLDFDRFLNWIQEPPDCSTFRVNSLKYSKEEAQGIIEKSLDEVADQNGFTGRPAVQSCSLVDDVFIIGSWNRVPNFVEKPTGEKISKADEEVVVDASCGAAILRGAHLFAPGVLSMSRGMEVGQKVSVFADLDGKCLQGSTSYQGRKKLVGKGLVELARDALFNDSSDRAKGVAVRIKWTPQGILTFNFPSALGQLQNLPSSAASWELNPRPGDSVLDMCASPGNKTSHLAALMQNEGTLIAIDRTEKKCDLVRQTCEKFGAKSLVFCYDSTKACQDNVERVIEEGPPFSQNSFDKILLDAPCSALGQRPQLLNKISAGQIKSNPLLQKRLFRTAVNLLKPGGELVYCTCSTTFDENEGLINWAMQEFQNILVLQSPRKRVTQVIPLKNVPEEIYSKVQRFGPPTDNAEECSDSIGFFISRFKKV
ncbi:tRNA (cytosine(72)-C(5))-methyltransferase NSUN6-like isoform X2 [Neocloeon triangulifer]|nr:tRNA (cytosine(72)-C(5))-methyltransferase NSUN6-like isoform X2 [Neocloeon triangulifer]